MEIASLLESFTFRFASAGVHAPERASEELLAHVFNCHAKEVYHRSTPLSSGRQIEIIRQLEQLATRIENGESPQDVLNCVDF